MIRVSGSNVFFYSHKFSDSLLNSIADGIEPLECSEIQKFTRIVNGIVSHDFSLLSPDDRVSIFEILDEIQQIISKMWTFVVFEFSICSLYCSIWVFFLVLNTLTMSNNISHIFLELLHYVFSFWNTSATDPRDRRSQCCRLLVLPTIIIT